MPYYRDGKKSYRVSEPLSSLECENIGFQVVRGDPKRPRVANAVTIPGTFGHYRIAREIADIQGLERPKRPQQNDGVKKIIKDWRAQGSIKEMLYDHVQSMLRNWKKFWNDYEITPLRVEETMFWEVLIDGKTFPLAGTVDLIARVKLKGTVDDEAFFHRCMHGVGDPLCVCEEMEAVTMMDWKYSVAPQDSHPMQMAAYRIGSRRSGLDKITSHNFTYPMNYHNWSLLFRTPMNKPPDYKLKEYPYDMIGNFFLGCRLLLNPKPIPRTFRTGSLTVKFFCTFCAEKLNCPLNGFWIPESHVNERVSSDIMTVF